jgi:hypothetical protein
MRVWTLKSAIFLSSIGLQLGLPSFALEREKSVENCAGEVVSLQGKVLLRHVVKGKTDETLTLKAGNNIYPGDVINTGSDGAVKILLKDKTIVDLSASSLFEVAQFNPKEGGNREVELDMMFGKMRVAVTKKLNGTGKFKLKTRAATMGVRGTEFVATSSNDSKAPETDVVVLQGKVDFAKTDAGVDSKQAVHLTAGNQVTTLPGDAVSQVQKLNPTQMNQVTSTSKMIDNTFLKAVTVTSNPPTRGSNTTSANQSDSSGRTPAAQSQAPAVGSLQSAVATMAAQVPTIPVSITEIGVPGAPSVVNTVGPVTQNNRTYHVTVVVK